MTNITFWFLFGCFVIIMMPAFAHAQYYNGYGNYESDQQWQNLRQQQQLNNMQMQMQQEQSNQQYNNQQYNLDHPNGPWHY